MQKMFRFGLVVISTGVVLSAAGLGGCYQAARYPAPAAAIPRGPIQPAWPDLPENAACTKDLKRFQAVLWDDVTTGNLNQSVYDKIEADLDRAADACAQGQDSEARAIIRSTKLKHGYRAFL